MTSKAYISSITVSRYYGGEPAGNIHINHGDGEGTSTIRLDKQDCEKFWALAMAIFEERKLKMAEEIATMKLQPLLGYDKDKTIEADDTPF